MPLFVSIGMSDDKGVGEVDQGHRERESVPVERLKDYLLQIGRNLTEIYYLEEVSSPFDFIAFGEVSRRTNRNRPHERFGESHVNLRSFMGCRGLTVGFLQ